MSEPKSYPRPRQVTTAGILGAVGGVLLVLSLYDSVSRLRTVEMRDAVQEFLGEPPGNGLGVSVGWVLDALHVVMLVNGALAAVATVLAVYVFLGHRGARIGFTVVAAVLVFTSPFTGGVLAVLLAVAAVMLWSRPAREWFAGRDPAEPAVDEMFPTARRREQPDPSWSPPAERSELRDRPAWPREDSRRPSAPDRPDDEQPADRPPPAAHPFGQPVVQQWSPPAAEARSGPGPLRPPPAPRRPGAVVAAALVTWGLSSLVFFVFSVVVAMLMGAQDVLLDQVAQDPNAATMDLTSTDVLALFWVVSAMVLFWCLAAAALAVLVLKRQNWARLLLALSCVMTIVVSAAVGVAGMDLAVALACMIYVVGAGVTIVLLYTARANAWFAGRGRPQQPTRAHQPEQRRQPSGKPPVW